MAAHHEVHLEKYIVDKLVDNGWVEGKAAKYDKQRAIYSDDVVKWVKDTQLDAWNKLERINGDDAERVLLDRLDKELSAKAGGTIKVYREGFNVAGAGHITMSQAAPEDKNNDAVIKKYKANICRVVRQLKYCPTREWAIDLVFFINGLAVATVEIKTDFTQSLEDAIEQYKKDRLPLNPQTKRREPLLTFKRGAIVHFAMSDSEISMTTRLQGDNTFFLPFNKGNHGHAGNAAREDGEYPVAYFWEELCTKENWLRIFSNFVFVETQNVVDKQGKPDKKETLIFPRYHQMQAVNNMVADVRNGGIGQQYLFEHSAGSGKTNTIAWTAHDLIKLRQDDGRAYFNSVIIVTDRTVLDAQLQDAVQQLDHQFGVIDAIDRKKSSKPKSQQLADALKQGTPIIIVTIQTFPFAMEAILTEQSLNDSNFAVIIDEAHTSQTGSTAQGLRAALSLDSKTKLETMTVEEILLEVQKSRVRPDNVSHFAFTATPKHSTLTLFGRVDDPTQKPSDENQPKPFHQYTQRQAIEEGFILDVLENYVPYQTAFALGEQALSDKRVDKKFARRALARWKSLHPTNVTQKVEFIMNHFSTNVAHLLNGEAKAMVVTSGRPQAVKYKLAFDKYIKVNNLDGIKALVAFSGKVSGKDVGDDGDLGVDIDAEYTEYNLNPDAKNQDLRHVFDQDLFKVMIVANKFQTGFNQPKLVAMYLDKKLSGVDAVQTLSRLNRTYAGKDQTFIMDFANEPETIIDAFKMYDKGATIESVQDLNVLYDMKNILDDAAIYHSQDLTEFMEARGKALIGNEVSDSIHRKLYAATQRPTDVFNSRLAELNKGIDSWEKAFNKAHKESDKKAENYAEGMRSELTTEREGLMRFKSDLARFVRTYNYIAQLIELSDASLENFAAFAKLFSKRLKGITPEQVDLTGLVLKGFALKKRDSECGEDDPTKLKPLVANPTDPTDREKEYLSEIIQRMNDIFGDVSDDTDQRYFTAQVANAVQNNEVVTEQIDKNSRNQALQGNIADVVRHASVKSMKAHGDNAKAVLSDPQNMEAFLGLIYDIVKHKNVNTILQQ